jgi:hypothetical protein
MFCFFHYGVFNIKYHMIGTNLYPKKSRTRFFLIMYFLMLVTGIVLSVQPVLRDEGLPGATGFMIVFGAGMFIMTFYKSRKPQISIFGDFLELNQSRTKELVRYRYITGVTRPDSNRLVVRLTEDEQKKEVTVWLRDLDKADIEKLSEFLLKKARKKK